MHILVLLSLLALTPAVRCDWPLTSDFSYWLWQSAVVVDQWLYIEGGEYYTLDADNVTSTQQELIFTLSIDLSRSWHITNVSVLETSKPVTMSSARRPPLWYDPVSNLVMERGGWAYSEGSEFELWSFKPNGSGNADWSLNLASPAAQEITSTFGGAFVASNHSFYSLGGATSASMAAVTGAGGVAQPVDGLTTFDFATGHWANTSSLLASDSGNSVLAQAAFIPNFGHLGLLAFLGGDSAPDQSYTYESSVSLVDMSKITVYDIKSDTWYHQTATGAVPPPRTEFCAVGSTAKDNSSYEIYVYGGSTDATFDAANPQDKGYLDVFVLSMPSFIWYQAPIPTEARRANHFCQVIGEGQMLAIGGRNPSSTLFWDGVDPWTHGMNIFDMSELKWTDSYNASATYERPDVVNAYYANHANETVWDDPALGIIFAPNSTSSSPKPGTKSKARHTGAIVGGLIAGVVCLIALATLLVFCLLRRRRRDERLVKHNSPIYELTSQGVSPRFEMSSEQRPGSTQKLPSPPVEMPVNEEVKREHTRYA